MSLNEMNSRHFSSTLLFCGLGSLEALAGAWSCLDPIRFSLQSCTASLGGPDTGREVMSGLMGAGLSQPYQLQEFIYI